MKDQEFMELLNLYLDHEISEADAARLEVEVVASPGRQRIYRDYCRMDRACALLGDLDAATAPARRRTSPAPARHGWATGLYAAGVLAAACIAAVFVLRTGPAPSQAPAVAAAAPVPASYRPQLQPVFTAGPASSLAEFRAPRAEQADQFSWINAVRLEPMQGMRMEPAMFEPTPVLIDLENRAIRTPSTLQTTAERAAFQFQR
jgi:hypothetical protein